MKSKLKEAGEEVQKAHDATHQVETELAKKNSKLEALMKQVQEQGALVRELS